MTLINKQSTKIQLIKLSIDLTIIIATLFFLLEEKHQAFYFYLYITMYWVISTFSIGFYKVYRYTGFYKVLSLLFIQILVFSLGFFAFFGIFKEGEIVNNQFKILFLIFTSIGLLKILFYLALKKYRSLGKDIKKTIIIGFDSSAKKIIKLFNNKPNLGYKFLGFFSDDEFNSTTYLGKIQEAFEYAKSNQINEIYATTSQLKKEQIKIITKFANQNNIQLKLIPNTDELFSKNRQVEFYGDDVRVFSVKKLPFEIIENKILKRIFDIIFSSIVLLFVMSWLIPILWILIKIESKGPLFFKQEREGLNGDKFLCYKFRSMRKNNLDIHATKNDSRVTKVGAFIRKTSIDELPQFFNVFFGDMSVVGPRPHMRSLAIEYQKDVSNYMDRHAVKPGITGLAQVSGYRGEIKKPTDIINRVRFDIFYIENWSFLFDIKIIIRTVLNVFRGEENAY